MKPAPCRMAEASIAPNISPPGRRNLNTTSAVRGRRHDEDGEFGDRRRAGCDEARHQPTALQRQPEVGQPRRNAERQGHHAHGLHNGDSAEVGLVLGGERHHLRERARAGAEQRRLRVPAVNEAQIRARRRDHAQGRDRQHEHARAEKPRAPSASPATPRRRAKSRPAPISTRDSGTGICTGRPHSAAAATPSSEPVTRPAGNPSPFKVKPQTAAIASVSAARSHSLFAGIGKDAIAAINAAPGKPRQTRPLR